MASEKYRALIVDDESTILKLVVRELSRRNFECQTAFDGSQAAQMAAHSRYDAVITDLKMPHMNGHALALELLQQVDRPVVVIHTGVMDSKLAADLLNHGVDDIVFKPVDAGFLADKVKAMVERRRQRGEASVAADKCCSEQAARDVIDWAP
jgi:DNA-binding response OmpR family regulator